MVSVTPRGIRNNNPLNIRISSNNWLGKDKPSRDSQFETFDTMEHGLRAAFVIIRTYIVKYGLCYVGAVIKRFAPPKENNWICYTSNVCLYSGIDRSARLYFDDKVQMVKLLWAMSIVECGHGWVSKNQVESVYEKYFGK